MIHIEDGFNGLDIILFGGQKSGLLTGGFPRAHGQYILCSSMDVSGPAILSRSAQRPKRWILCVIALYLGLWGCQSKDAPPQLQVYAASSLTEAFDALETAFEKQHPEVDVALSFAGSQVLRLQIEQGARADVFASANPDHIKALVQAGLMSAPEIFAHNELVVITPLANPAGIDSFQDLARARRLVIGTTGVPVGQYTRKVLEATEGGFAEEVLGRVVSYENNVRLLRTRVVMGEADAAVVYGTDAMDSNTVRAVPISPAFNVKVSYAMGLVKNSDSGAGGALWLRFVSSSEGQKILQDHGFKSP